MNIQRVKQGAKITHFNGIYTMVLGIFFILFRDLNMKSNFYGINKLWGFFSKYNPEISHLFSLLNILIGILLVSIGIAIIYLSDFIIKRKDKMAWVTLFILGITTWVSLLVISILLENWALIIFTFIGWASFVFGMIIPIKYYIQKSYREY